MALRHLRDVELPLVLWVIESQAARLAVLEPLQGLLDVEDPELLAVVKAQSLRIAELERRLGLVATIRGLPRPPAPDHQPLGAWNGRNPLGTDEMGTRTHGRGS